AAAGKSLEDGIFDDRWIQPAAGAGGGAVGAALSVSHARLGVQRRRDLGGRDGQRGSYLGPAFSSAEVRAFLDRRCVPYHVIADDRVRASLVAEALSRGHV